MYKIIVDNLAQSVYDVINTMGVHMYMPDLNIRPFESPISSLTVIVLSL